MHVLRIVLVLSASGLTSVARASPYWSRLTSKLRNQTTSCFHPLPWYDTQQRPRRASTGTPSMARATPLRHRRRTSILHSRFRRPFGARIESLQSLGLSSHLRAAMYALDALCWVLSASPRFRCQFLGGCINITRARRQVVEGKHGVCRGALEARAPLDVHDLVQPMAGIAGTEEQDGARRRARERALAAWPGQRAA